MPKPAPSVNGVNRKEKAGRRVRRLIVAARRSGLRLPVPGMRRVASAWKHRARRDATVFN